MWEGGLCCVDAGAILFGVIGVWFVWFVGVGRLRMETGKWRGGR